MKPRPFIDLLTGKPFVGGQPRRATYPRCGCGHTHNGKYRTSNCQSCPCEQFVEEIA